MLLALVLFYGVARFIVVFTDSRLTGDREPYIQLLSQDAVTIRWLTDDEQLGVVRYGEVKDHLTRIELDEDTSNDHSVRLTGLKPGRLYYYQVGNSSSFQPFQPENHWFRTFPADDEDVDSDDADSATRIWVIGDSGQEGEILYQVRDQAFNWMRANPLKKVIADDGPEPLFDIWLALGDIAYRSGTNEQFQSALFEPFSEVLSSIPLLPVYGNHDDRRWTYFRIFDLPEKAEAGGVASGTENYYAVDYANVHFVVLDSQGSDRDIDGEMVRWLEKDLAQNTRPWVIVAFHHPPYTRGSHDSDDEGDSDGRMNEMRENVLPVLEKAGVDLVLSGHSHMYERSYMIDCAYGDSKAFSGKNIVSSGVNQQHTDYIKPLNINSHQGTVYAVAGSSSKVDLGPMDHPAHHRGFLEAGSMVLDVVANKLTARFINNNGQVTDTFSIEKKADFESGYEGCEQ